MLLTLFILPDGAFDFGKYNVEIPLVTIKLL